MTAVIKAHGVCFALAEAIVLVSLLLSISKLLVTYLKYFYSNILHRQFTIHEIEPKSVSEVQIEKKDIQFKN